MESMYIEEVEIFQERIYEDVYGEHHQELDGNTQFHYQIFLHGVSEWGKIHNKLIINEDIKQEVYNKMIKKQKLKEFITAIEEELIAKVMHPCRIQMQLDQFEDIEQYFEAIGY